MKKSIMLLAAVVLMAGFTTRVMAQTASASAGAKIVAATTITKVTDLHFGTMTVPTAATTVLLTPLNVRTAAAGIILLPGAPVSQAASYTTAGPVSGTYQITLPSTPVTLTSGANNMTATTFTCSEGTPAAAPLNGSGAGAFTVGATLNLASGQAAGVYAGTFDVTVTTN